MAERKLHRRHIVSVIWDFDKTLIPGYMQAPLFRRYGIDERRFWNEVNALPAIYAERGTRVPHDTIYLNHLLTYVQHGPLKGLRNADLRELGKDLTFYPGLPSFFDALKAIPKSLLEYRKHDIHLEHYIVSTGLTEIVRGSAVAGHVDGIFANEFVESPLMPGYDRENPPLPDASGGIAQIGQVVDNTIKTRFIFEINKGTNRNTAIDVNAKMDADDRRVPIPNMIYVADGPSDVPVFSVVRKGGGKCFAVYDPHSQAEFEQNDQLLQDGRVHGYGPADFTEHSQTSRWLTLQVRLACERIVEDGERALAHRVKRPPRHLRDDPRDVGRTPPRDPQDELFADTHLE